MWNGVSKVFKDCGTENNGSSYDMARVAPMFMVATGFPVFLFLCVYSTIHRIPFDMIAFGTAFGAMLGGVAAVTAGVAFKQRTDINITDGGTQ
jgi:hypothetical protein